MAKGTPRFGTVARQRQAEFRTTLSREAQRPNDDKGLRNPHLLAVGYEIENLYPPLREPDGALAFFRKGTSNGGAIRAVETGPLRTDMMGQHEI